MNHPMQIIDSRKGSALTSLTNGAGHRNLFDGLVTDANHE